MAINTNKPSFILFAWGGLAIAAGWAHLWGRKVLNQSWKEHKEKQAAAGAAGGGGSGSGSVNATIGPGGTRIGGSEGGTG